MNFTLLILLATLAVLALLISRFHTQSSFGDEDDEYQGPTPIPPLTAKAVEKLAYAGATDIEIADRFLVEPAVITGNFPKVLRVSRALRKMTHRGWQMDLCRKLNSPLLMWIGKNELGQANKPQDGDDPEPELHES